MSIVSAPRLVVRGAAPKLIKATVNKNNVRWGTVLDHASSSSFTCVVGMSGRRRDNFITFVPLSTTTSKRSFQSMSRSTAASAVGSHGSGHSTTSNNTEDEDDRYRKLRIIQTLFTHVWPKTNDSLTPQQKQEVAKTKQRATVSLGLMVGAKLINIQVPFLFKGLVDRLPSSPAVITTEDLITVTDILSSSDITTTASASTAMPPIILAMLLGYGISRATATGMQELRNAIFAHVAQDAIRKVGRSVFDHIHALDLQFHLERNTGGE